MKKIFMCDIMTGHDEEYIDLEQVLIKAISPTDAFKKLVNARHYIDTHIYKQRNDVLFAHVKVEDRHPVINILIGKPKETIE